MLETQLWMIKASMHKGAFQAYYCTDLKKALQERQLACVLLRTVPGNPDAGFWGSTNANPELHAGGCQASMPVLWVARLT